MSIEESNFRLTRVPLSNYVTVGDDDVIDDPGIAMSISIAEKSWDLDPTFSAIGPTPPQAQVTSNGAAKKKIPLVPILLGVIALTLIIKK